MFEKGDYKTGIAVIIPHPDNRTVKVRISENGLELMVETEDDYKQLLAKLEQVKISMRNCIEKEAFK